MSVVRSLALAAMVLASCVGPTSSSSAPTPFATSSATMIAVPAPSATPRSFVPTSDAQVIAGGCGQTKVLKGGIPQTLVEATGNNAPGGPYAIARPPLAAAFLFGYPLHVPDSGIAYSNKILWVVGTPRTGDLVIDARPLGATSPTVHYVEPPDSFPGEIYPSGIDVPMRGCWHFQLRWAGQSAEIELEYR
jgi:hypothetical protein